MSKNLLLLLCLWALFACHKNAAPTTTAPSPDGLPVIKTTAVNSSIRALERVNDDYAWFAGSDGYYGYSEDGGEHWHIDSIRLEGQEVGFRALAVTSKAVFLLSTDSPALVFRSTDKGENWEIMYREDHPECYYNALKFWDDETGIAVGDPTEANCLSVLMTRDGGESWFKIACGELPALADNEAGFAASNTNIALFGDHAWLVTGGQKARVFHTPDRGASWEVFDTPIQQGGEMTGIYSITFRDQRNGIIWGGDWNDKASTRATKAMTTDGGNSWTLIADGQEPGFRSCVQYVPGTEGRQLLAVGIPGIAHSADGGQHWRQLSDESFYAIRINNAGKRAWLAGRYRVGYMRWE